MAEFGFTHGSRGSGGIQDVLAGFLIQGAPLPRSRALKALRRTRPVWR